MYLKRQWIGGINEDRIILIWAAAPKFGYRVYYINYKEIGIVFYIIYIFRKTHGSVRTVTGV